MTTLTIERNQEEADAHHIQDLEENVAEELEEHDGPAAEGAGPVSAKPHVSWLLMCHLA